MPVELDLRQTDLRRAYQTLSRVVVPRPIALVSSLGADGVGNLAPFSFFNLGGMNPPSLVFCPLNDRHGKVKDTVLNVEQTGELVVNVVSRAMAEQMNQASWDYPREVDEFDVTGFTRAPSVTVAPPRVAESPVQLEARLYRLLRHGEGPLASNYIIAEVLYVHLSDAVVDADGLPDHRLLDAIGRLGGDDYCRTTPETLFALARPQKPA